MSHTYSLVCRSMELKLWVGQGWDSMTGFYSGDKLVMENLRLFLRATYKCSLELMRDQDLWNLEESLGRDFKEFGEDEVMGISERPGLVT